jgi:hypothetical protein
MADDFDFDHEEFFDQSEGNNVNREYEEEDDENNYVGRGGRERTSRRSNNQEEDDEEEPERDEDDEQQQQKINGKIETLLQKVESLELDLLQEKQSNLEIQQKYEIELQSAWKEVETSRIESKQLASASNNDGAVSQLQSEVNKLKKQNDNLQDKLDIALLTNPSTSSSSVNAVPLQLQEEFLKFCTKYSLFPDLQEKPSLSLNDAMKVLQGINSQLKKKEKSATSSSSSSRLYGGKTDDDGATVTTTTSNKQDQLSSYHQHHKLNDKVKALEEELKLAAGYADDINHLKTRIMQLSDRIRTEKEHKRSLEVENVSFKRKIDMLSDHIEKLVLHIKREGAQKVKYAENTRLLEKDNSRLKEKFDLLSRKVSAKDRLIYELREGSRVLEDQLKLMDEKYLELRNKLDYARYIASKKIKKAEKVAADLRVKFAISSGSVLPLDSLPMPSTAGEYSMGGGGGDDASSYNSGAFRRMNSEGRGFDGGPMTGESGMMESQSFTIVPGGLVPNKSGMRRNNSNKLQVNVDGAGNIGDGIPTLNSSMSFKSNNSVLSLDNVLEKIRQQQGSKNDWTEDKARKLISYNNKVG